MKRMVLLCLILFSLCAVPVCAETLTFYTDDDFPPFSYKEDGEVKGIDVDLVRELFSRIGFQTQTRPVPWKRVLVGTAKGTVDGSFSLFRTPEREGYALFADAEPLHYSTYVLFVSKGKEFPFTRIEDLFGKVIGINAGFSISAEFDQAVQYKQIEVEELENVSSNVRKLLAGRIDAFVSNKEVTLYTLKKMGLADQITFLPSPVKARRGAYLVLSKKSPALANPGATLKQVQKALKEMHSDGTFQAINDKYLK